jgi:hypothetical protein
MLELDGWCMHRQRQRIMGLWPFTSLVLQSTKIPIMGKMQNKVAGEVRALIICRWSISRWCNLWAIVARDIMLVRAPILTKCKSYNISNLASWIIPEGIEVFWLLLASHEVTKKKVRHKHHFIGNSDKHKPGEFLLGAGVFSFFIGRMGSLK